MFPIFTALAAFALSLSWTPEISTPWYDPRATLLGLAALLFLQVLCGHAYARESRRRIPGETGEVRVRRLTRAENAYRFLALVFHAAAILNLNWPQFAWGTLRLGGLPGISVAAALVPYPLFVFATAAGIARAWRVPGTAAAPLFRTVLAGELRLAALPLVPALAVVGGFELLTLHRGLRLFLASVPFAGLALLAAALAVALLASPAWLPRVLRARPFPDSPLRSDLLRLCERAGVATPDFWLWPASGSVNAMVVGLRSRGRAVLFTEAMIETLSADELGAVLAHELGHVRHRHSAVYAALALGAVCALAAAETALASMGPGAAQTAAVAALGGAIALAFGAFYRRFERQADLFAARLVPATVFIATLEKIAALAGNVRKVWTFTHTSIEQRVNFLLDAGVRPDTAARFERRLSRAVTAGLVAAAFAGGAGLWTAARQVREAPRERARILAEEAASEARAAWEKDDHEAALRKAAEAAKGDPKWELLLAGMLFEAGRAIESRPHYEAARAEWADGTEERIEIEERLKLIEGMEERRRATGR